ncbi:BT1A1 protein, partial [Oceanites oceanicus]|nr:BT1A1 protein [Oceanites oceanicus]
LFLAGGVPITISIIPSVVLVGEQVTLSCQLTDSVPSNMSVRWYKMEKGRDAPLCSSSSLGGVVEQHQDEEQWRIAGRWQKRAFLLVIQQVQVADEGAYVCAVNSSVVTQEAATHLDVTAIGNKPTLDRDLQEESMCRYTCKSKQWYPKPEVIWMNYGGDPVNVEAKTNVTWSERDRFTVQSIITVPCDNVDVVCVIKLIKSKISRSAGAAWLGLCQGSAPWSAVGLLLTLPFCVGVAPVWAALIAPPSPHLSFAEELQPQGGAGRGAEKRDCVQCAAIMALPKYLFVVDDIKVDGDTAHPNLSIAVDKKSFTHKSQAQKVTQNERSFDSFVCVLGSEGFSSGKHYWEVDIEKSNDWDLGVATKSAPRKGIMSLSPKEGFWALGLSFKAYWARTDPWTLLAVQEYPRKIGVYLNCEEKILTFFNVTDMSVMFTFKDCAFSEEVYPFFKSSH